MNNVHLITTDEIGWERIESVISQKKTIALSDEVTGKINRCREYQIGRASCRERVCHRV